MMQKFWKWGGTNQKMIQKFWKGGGTNQKMIQKFWKWGGTNQNMMQEFWKGGGTNQKMMQEFWKETLLIKKMIIDKKFKELSITINKKGGGGGCLPLLIMSLTYIRIVSSWFSFIICCQFENSFASGITSRFLFPTRKHKRHIVSNFLRPSSIIIAINC